MRQLIVPQFPSKSGYHPVTIRPNSLLIRSFPHFTVYLTIALDPSYVSKSGKHSAGVGYFWSGSAGQAKWGQEFCGLAAVDLRDKTALHLLAVQTMGLEEEESLLDYYASIVTINAAKLRRVSSYLVADAYFAKASFAASVLEAGLHLNRANAPKLNFE